MRQIYLLFIAILFFFACNKEELPNENIINQYSDYWNANAEGKRLFELRCAFAKTVANAFEDDEFRTYFKNNFGKADDGHFPELVFSQHINTSIKQDGTTLYKLLSEFMDEEVRELHGTDFLELVLEFDPMVVIKLPDEFRFFNWETADIVPMVIPYTPGDPFGKEGNFLAYFYDGAFDIVKSPFDYFYGNYSAALFFG